MRTQKVWNIALSLSLVLCILFPLSVLSLAHSVTLSPHSLSAEKVLNPRNSRKRKHDEVMQRDIDREDGMADGLKKRKVDLTENLNRMNVHYDEARARLEAKPKVKATPKSRSISKLSKADTSGMKSMMNYFKKSKK